MVCCGFARVRSATENGSFWLITVDRRTVSAIQRYNVLISLCRKPQDQSVHVGLRDFEVEPRTVLTSSYAQRRKLWPIIEVLRYTQVKTVGCTVDIYTLPLDKLTGLQ